MVGGSKLDMSLDDLIKKAKKPTGKAKPGQQKQQGKAGPQQQQKSGIKGKAAPQQQQQQQKKGVQLKAKGGVSKPGAGTRPGSAKGAQQQLRPVQRPKSQPDVRIVPRPGRPVVGGRGMGPRPGAPRLGMGPRPGMRPNMRPGMQTRQMGGFPMMQAPYNMAPMGMGMGMQAPMMVPEMQQQITPAAAPTQPAPQQGKWQNDLFDGSVVSSSTSAKLFISNLDFKVTDEDIKELFGTVGTIKDSAIHYDKSGRSLGTAYVVFEKRADALTAFNRYNNVSLDNKKMSIEVVETAVPRGTFKTLSSGINVSRQQQGGAAGGARGRGMPQSVAVASGDYMQE